MQKVKLYILKSNQLICAILLVLMNIGYAGSNNAFTFNQINKQIAEKKYLVDSNPSKNAAIASWNGDGYGPILYIDYKTKKIYHLREGNQISVTWLSNTVAILGIPCGTNCQHDQIFIAPAILVSCASHDYDFSQTKEKLSYSSNSPLLVDPKRKIYVCYDSDQNIQVYPFPTHASIKPPQKYHAIRANAYHDKLVITYKSSEKKKQVSY